MKDCTTVVTSLLYLLVVVLSLCAAQSPAHIYSDTSGTILAVDPLGGPSKCATTYLILRANYTNCLAMITLNGVVELGCNPYIQGATTMHCVYNQVNADVCFFVNPVQNTLVEYWPLKRLYSYVDLAGIMEHPTVFSVLYDVNYDLMDVILVDANNSLGFLQINYPEADYFTAQPVPLAVTPSGVISSVILYDVDTFSFLLVSQGDTTITQYNVYSDTPDGTFGTFGNIQMIAPDAYGHVYVIDSACSCITEINYSGTVLRTISNLVAPAKLVSLSRTKVLVIDDRNIWKYEEEHVLSASVSMRKSITCTGQPGQLNVQVEGQGDFPFTLYVFPDAASAKFNASGNATISITANPIQSYEVQILDDELNRNFQLNGMALAGRGFFNKSVIPGGSQSGNYSYGWRFTATNGGITINCGGIQTGQFEYIEFWLNVGNGGQYFSLQLSPSQEIIEIVPGDIPNGQWKMFRMNLPYYLFKRGSGQVNSAFQGMQFNDLLHTNTQNYIYIDNVRLIPYPTLFPDRTAYVFDACGASLAPMPVPFVVEPLRVDVVGTPVNCNVNTTTATPLAYNGVLEARITNGKAPFFYNWTYSPLNQSRITDFPILNSYITIYDNALNKSWVDISIGDTYTLNETSTYKSEPACISFTVTNEGQGLIFQISPELDLFDFYTIEFWANGGEVGGQTFSIYLLRSTSGTLVQTASFATASGLISLPRNKWVKMSYTLPGGPSHLLNSNTKYNLIEIVSTIPTSTLSPTPSINQATVYIDDIILVGNPILTVTDSLGCKVTTPFARITTPPAITQTINVVNAKCFNYTDGIVQVVMTGGVEPFDFSWSGSNQETGTLAGLGEGFVNVNATDFNMCTFKPATATVLQPPPITLSISVAQPKCFGGTGVAKASAFGGAGQFTYNWLSSSAIAQTLTSPAPEAIFLDSLTPPLHAEYATIVCRGTGTHLGLAIAPTHSGYCTISINLTPTIATAVVRGCATCFARDKYASLGFWIFGDNVASLQTFSFTMTQGNLKSNFSVPLASLVTLTAQTWTQVIVNMSRFTDLTAVDGFAFVSSAPATVTGSVLVDDVVIFPINSNGAGFSAMPGFVSTMQVKAADYFISVVDGNGCSSITKLTVPQPTQINITYIATSPTFQDGNDGAIDVQVSGGTAPYSYQWLEINLTSEDISNVVYGAYVLRVTDANGCIAELNAYIDPYIPVVEVTIRKYNANLSSGLAALVSVGFIICLFSGTMLFRYWASFSVLGSFLSTMILLGCVLSFLSALVLLPEPSDGLCLAFIWFLGVGFALVYGCLFIKTWALYKVWRNAVHYHKAALTPLYIVKCLGLVVTVEVIFLAIWTALDPPKVHLVKSLNNTIERQCSTSNMTFWIIFLVGKGSWLIFGAVLSILTKNIAKEYNESSSIAYAIYNNVLLGAIAIPLAILLKEVPGGRLTVQVVIITIAFSFTLVVIFFKIWHNIILPDKIPMGREMRKNRNTASSTGSIKTNSGERQSKGSPTLSASASVSTVNLRDAAEHSEA